MTWVRYPSSLCLSMGAGHGISGSLHLLFPPPVLCSPPMTSAFLYFQSWFNCVPSLRPPLAPHPPPTLWKGPSVSWAYCGMGSSFAWVLMAALLLVPPHGLHEGLYWFLKTNEEVPSPQNYLFVVSWLHPGPQCSRARCRFPSQSGPAPTHFLPPFTLLPSPICGASAWAVPPSELSPKTAGSLASLKPFSHITFLPSLTTSTFSSKSTWMSCDPCSSVRSQPSAPAVTGGPSH